MKCENKTNVKYEVLGVFVYSGIFQDSLIGYTYYEGMLTGSRYSELLQKM